MMGILDALKYSTGDPEKDAQLNRGLLMAGLQLMQSKGSLFPALGQAGMAGVMGADQTRQQQQRMSQQKMQEQMQRLQIGGAQREADIANLPGQFYRAPSQPAFDATGGMETAVEAPNNASGPGGFDAQGYAQALMGKSPQQGLAFQQMLKKPEVQPLVSKPGDVARDPKTGAILWQNPEAADGEKDAFVRVMKTAGIDPASEQGRKMLGAYLQKMGTHPPAATMNNYGSPLPISLPGGGEGYIQPSTRPGGPSQILTIPGTNTPAQKPGGPEKAPSEFEAKAGLYFKSMQQATGTTARLEGSGRTDYLPTLAELAAPENAKEFVRSQGRKAYVQAQMQWIDSINRVRSGANLPEIEYHRAVATFFPTTGDGVEQVKQKAIARAQEEAAMRAAAGRAIGGGSQPVAAAQDSDPLGLRGK